MTVLPAVHGSLGSGSTRFELNVPPVEVRDGSIVYLIGPNGSGKSVYLRALCGEFRELTPRWPKGDQLRPILIRQAADENLALNLTVLQNMIVWDRAQSLAEVLIPASRNPRVRDRLQQFPALGLTPEKYVRDLSGGQKQGLVLLSRLQRLPHLLLLDEFTSAVDVQTSNKLLDVVQQQGATAGTTSIVVSHDLMEASLYTESCLVLSGGLLVAQEDLTRLAPDARHDRLRALLIDAWQRQISTSELVSVPKS